MGNDYRARTAGAGFAHFLRIEIIGSRIDIDESGLGADPLHSQPGCRAHITGEDDIVAMADAERAQSQFQSNRAGTDCHAAMQADVGGDPSFKLRDHGPGSDLARPKHLGHCS